MLDYNQIKEIIKEIDSSSLRVFELECQDIKLKLSKNKENSIYKDNKDYSKEEKISSYLNKEISLEKEVAKEVTDEVKEDFNEENYNIVKSPLVGAYYSASTPGGTPYVEVGSRVKKGDTLCIIEAMKVMNEITSEFDGEIVEVLRKDEDIVEFGMELFKIK